MKINKAGIMSLIFLLIFIFGINFSSALYVGNLSINLINSPASNLTFNVTYNAYGTNLANGEVNQSHLYLSIGSPSTANLSYNITSGGGIGNKSINNSAYAQFIIEFNTTGIEDSNDYTITAILTNMSAGSTNISTTATYTSDNTIPTAPSSLSPTTDTDGDVSFSATVTDSETIACLLVFTTNTPGTNKINTMTYSTNSCTLTLNSIPEQTYNYVVQASDGTNFTNSSVQTLNVAINSGGGKSSAQLQAEGSPLAIFSNASGQISPLRVIIAILMIWGIFYLIRKK